ncbi:MAG: NAD(P)-binding domain-containing protein [Burkholderiaceae bacterium]|nr:NAD(P)-binding domain-containing protein [Burkholderiaceae bacterium]
MTWSRAADWKAGGIHYLDAHTTGGVAGLDRSCCLIIGGEADTVAHLRPVFSALACSKWATQDKSPECQRPRD